MHFVSQFWWWMSLFCFPLLSLWYHRLYWNLWYHATWNTISNISLPSCWKTLHMISTEKYNTTEQEKCVGIWIDKFIWLRETVSGKICRILLCLLLLHWTIATAWKMQLQSRWVVCSHLNSYGKHEHVNGQG